jgi:hypothetical protein
MTEPVKPKRPSVHIDRVNLTPAAFEKVELWIKQASGTLKGISLNRHNLVNWLIESRPAELSKAEIEDVRKSFYNEESLVKWAMRERREAQKRGESVSILDLIKSQSRNTAPKIIKKRKSKSELKNESNTEVGENLTSENKDDHV